MARSLPILAFVVWALAMATVSAAASYAGMWALSLATFLLSGILAYAAIALGRRT